MTSTRAARQEAEARRSAARVARAAGPSGPTLMAPGAAFRGGVVHEASLPGEGTALPPTVRADVESRFGTASGE